MQYCQPKNNEIAPQIVRTLQKRLNHVLGVHSYRNRQCAYDVYMLLTLVNLFVSDTVTNFYAGNTEWVEDKD